MRDNIVLQPCLAFGGKAEGGQVVDVGHLFLREQISERYPRVINSEFDKKILARLAGCLRNNCTVSVVGFVMSPSCRIARDRIAFVEK